MNNEPKYSIVIATGIYPPHAGGPALYSSEIEKVYRAQGHNVTIATFTYERSLPIGIRHLVYFWKTLMLLRGADIAVIVDTFSAAVPAVVAAKILGVPSIIRTGGDFLWEGYVERTRKKVLLRNFYATELPYLNLKEKIIFELIKFSYSCADVVAFSTEWQKNIFMGPYGLARLKHVTVIDNALVQGLAKGEAAPVAGEKTTSKLVYAVTRPLVWKNNDVLQKAVNAVRQQYPEMDVLFGPLEKADAQRKMQTAYVVAQVSLGDISPNMILEALSYGKPCIVTEECGILDKIRPYVTVVDPLNIQSIANALTTLASPQGYAEARARAEQYILKEKRDWKNVAQDIIHTAIVHTKFSAHHTRGERCLMISTDRNLLEASSKVALRHIQYAEKMSDLDIVVFSQGKQRKPLTLSEHCTVYSTQSSSKFLYILDAIIVAVQRPIPTKITCQDPFETGVVGLVAYIVMSLRSILFGSSRKVSFEVQLHTDISSKYFRSHSRLNFVRYLCSHVLLRLATHIRVVSHTLKRFLIQHMGIAADRIEVRPIEIDVVALDAVRHEREIWLAQQKNEEATPLHILVVSRLESEKRVHLALLISKQLLDRGVQHKITIAGSGTLDPSLKLRAQNLGVEYLINFIGYTPNVRELYGTHHVVLNLSLYEGYGMVLVEAVYAGVQLITTKVGVAEELSLEYPDKVTIVDGEEEKDIIHKFSDALENIHHKK